MRTLTDLKQLYEVDDSQWLVEMIHLLRNQQFEAIDLDHLIKAIA